MSNALETAIEAAKAASEILNDYYSRKTAGKVESKGGVDRVSDADKDSERKIRKIITKKFPDHSLAGEEFGDDGKKSDYKWYFDPLCGTFNFIRGFAEFGVSVALTKGEDLVLGVCVLPAFDEVYWAETGKGAFLNGEKIHVSGVDTLSDAIVTTDISAKIEKRKIQIELIDKLSGELQYVKLPGSYPYAVCNMARGKSDGHAELSVPPLHRLAATAVLLEAGGKVTKYNGSKASIFDDDIILSNGLIHDELLALIEKSK